MSLVQRRRPILYTLHALEIDRRLTLIEHVAQECVSRVMVIN